MVVVDEDGNVTRSDLAEEAVPAEPVAPADWGDLPAVETSGPDEHNPTPTAVPDTKEETGFQPGQSKYQGAEDGGLAHVWENSDGTTTVLYTELPSAVDPETGEVLDLEPLRKAGRRFERSADSNTVSVAVDSDPVQPYEEELESNKPDDKDKGPNGNKPVKRPAGSDALVAVDVDGEVFHLSVAGQSRRPGRLGADGVVRFDGLLPGIDVAIGDTRSGFKVDYEIQRSKALDRPIIETLQYPSGWTWEQGEGVVYLINPKGEIGFIWGGGLAFDAAGPDADAGVVRHSVVAADGDHLTAVVVVDDVWLQAPEREYPITIDPFQSGSVQVQDTWLIETVPPPNPADTHLRVGPVLISGQAYQARALAEFELFGEGAGYAELPVTDAKLYLDPSSTGQCATTTLHIRRVTSPWDATTAAWANQPGTTGSGGVDHPYNECSGSGYHVIDVDAIVQHWGTNPGTNHGFLIHVDEPGGPYRRFHSMDNTTNPPALVVTYDTAGGAYGAEYTTPDSVGEALLPIPGAYDTDSFGQIPVLLTNTGEMDWPSGKHASNQNPDPAKTVRLAYHILNQGGTPGVDPWLTWEGRRTLLPTGAANMYTWATGPQNPAPPPPAFTAAAAQIRNDHQGPGVYDIYLTMVHEGVTWFDFQGVGLSDPVTVRFTDPPETTSPIAGAVVSALEDVTFEWDKPHTGTSHAWTPTEYRLVVTNAGTGGTIHEETLPGTTTSLTVPAATFDGHVGTIVWQLQARDGVNEQAGGVQLWTHATSSAMYRKPPTMGTNPFAETFAGVDPAIGNLHLPFNDIALSASTPLSLTRHLNTQESEPGMFGMGLTTQWEMTFNCTGGCTTANPGNRILERGDGTAVFFLYDDNANQWEALDGSEAIATAASLGGDQVGWRIKFKDGSSYWFDNPTTNNHALGDFVWMWHPDGQQTTVTSSSTTPFPTTVTDDGSGRKINFELTSFFPYTPRSRVVTKAWIGTLGTNDYNEVNYTYSTSTDSNGNQSKWLHQACREIDTSTVACETYDWNTTTGLLQSVEWPAVVAPNNHRRVDVTYHPNGKVDTVTDGTNAVTTFVYNSGSTAINDGRNKNWTVEYDQLRNTTKLIDPNPGQTAYIYTDGRRTRVTDPAQNSAYLTYDDDGNLLTETNAAGETTYYRYVAAHYQTTGGGDPIINGPSHVCDTRSTGPTDLTYCTLRWYNSAGRIIREQTPGEPGAQAEEWVYTNGTSSVSGDQGTPPAGLLREHRDGNITASGGEGVTTYRYNSAGDLLKVTSPSGLVRTMTYDTLGRVETESETADSVTTTIRQVTSRYPNGRVHTEKGPAVVNTVSGATHQAQTTYVYDGNGNVVHRTVSDINGSDTPRTWSYTYDEMDRVTSATDPEGQTQSTSIGTHQAVTTTYDSNGNPETVTDARGNTTKRTYDNRNQVVKVEALSFDDGHGTTATRKLSEQGWYPDGLLHWTKTYTGTTNWIRETHVYDSVGRLLTTTVDDNTGSFSQQTLLNVYTHGLLTSSTSGDVGSTAAEDTRLTTFTHHQDGRIHTSTTGARTDSLSYDSVGNITENTTTGTGDDNVTLTSTTASVFDSAGNRRETIVENGTNDLKTTAVFDDRGNPTSVVSARGYEPGAVAADFTTTMVYDVLGRIVSTTGPVVPVEYATTSSGIEAGWHTGTAASIGTVGYDTFGNATHGKDARGNVTITSYDRNDRRTGVVHPTYTPPVGAQIVASETWAYDGNGNTVSYTTRNGNTTSWAFDDANMVVTQTDPQLPAPGGGTLPTGVTSTHYDTAGRVTQTVDPTGAVNTFSYDPFGRPSTVTQQVRAVSNQSALTAITSTTYTGLGSPKATTDPTGVVTTYTYNVYGEEMSTQTGTLNPASAGYDGLGRPIETANMDGSYTTASYDLAGRALTTSLYTATDVLVQTSAATYDAAGNMITSTDGRGATTNHDYNNADLLEQVTVPTDATGTLNYSYGYDQSGNLTSVTDGEGNTTLYTFNTWNLSEGVLEPATPGDTESTRRWETTYNAGGQAETELHPGGKTIQRTFNPLGLPATETSTQTGLATVAKTWFYDQAGRPIELSHPDAPIVLVYDDRGLFVSTTGGGGDSTTVHDEAGRIVTSNDEAGSVTYTYDANGQLDTASGDPSAVVAPSVIQPGMLVAYTGTGTPIGWVEANGQTFDQATYADLYAAIGDSYGGTATEFDVPDYQGRVLVGLDVTEPSFDMVGESGGSAAVTLTQAEMPSHTHVQGSHGHNQAAHTHPIAAHTHAGTRTTQKGNHTHKMGFNGSPSGSGNSFRVHSYGNKATTGSGFLATTGNHNHTTSINSAAINTHFASTGTNGSTTASNQNAGGSDAHNNLAPYVTARWLIATTEAAAIVPGMMVAYTGETAPTGWVDSADSLAAVDLAGRSLVGQDTSDTNFDTLGETGGTTGHTLATAEIPTHTHTQNAHTHSGGSHDHINTNHGHTGSTQSAGNHSHRVGWQGAGTGTKNSFQLRAHGKLPNGWGFTDNTGAHSHAFNTPYKTATISNVSVDVLDKTAVSTATGGDTRHENLQPYATVHWLTAVGATAEIAAGMVFPDASTTIAAAGWLTPEGQSESSLLYTELDAALDDAWGSSTSTTFTIPDLEGRILIDADAGSADFDAVGDVGGVTEVTLTQAQLPSHGHLQNPHDHTQGSHGHGQFSHRHYGTNASAGNHRHIAGFNGSPNGAGNALKVYAYGRVPSGYNFTEAAGNHRHNINVGNAAATSTGSKSVPTGSTAAVNQDTGGSQAHTNLQPYTVVSWRLAARSSGPATSGSWSVDYDHNAAAQQITQTYGDEGTRSFTYTDVGRLATDTLTDDTSTVTASVSYDWDCVGQLVSKTTVLPGNNDAGVNNYTYDHAGRLTSWNTTGTHTTCSPGVAVAPPTPVGHTYTYDDAGNRLTDGTETFTYDPRNRIASDGNGSYSWHPDGTLDTYTPATDPAEVYEFDAGGRIVDITAGAVSTDYSYDGLDRIAARNSVDNFTYPHGNIKPSTDGTNAYTRTGNQLLVHTDDTGAFAHPITDIHGDLIALADPDGTVTDTQTFEPYGEPGDTTGTTGIALGYQTDWTDPTTGHVWMGARWYQPSTATFLSRDTIFGELSTPFTLNRYTYAINNPIRFWDSTGRYSEYGPETYRGCSGDPTCIRERDRQIHTATPGRAEGASGSTQTTYAAVDFGSLTPPPPASAPEPTGSSVIIEIAILDNTQAALIPTARDWLNAPLFDGLDRSEITPEELQVVLEIWSFGVSDGGDLGRGYLATDAAEEAAHRAYVDYWTVMSDPRQGDIFDGARYGTLIPTSSHDFRYLGQSVGKATPIPDIGTDLVAIILTAGVAKGTKALKTTRAGTAVTNSIKSRLNAIQQRQAMLRPTASSPVAPRALPAASPGGVIGNALESHELAQAQSIVNFRGGTFVGNAGRGAPGIDGTLDGVYASLKTYSGSSPSGVLSHASAAESSARKAGFSGVEVFIDAQGVSRATIVDFGRNGPLSAIPLQGTVSSIYVNTADGWVVFPG